MEKRTTLRLLLLSILLFVFINEVVCGRDFYGILGVSRDASTQDIKTAYRALAKVWHPDKNKSPEAPKKFAEITDAYKTLSNEQKRRNYDQHGEDSNKPQQQQDPFFGMFGGQVRQQREGERKGDSLVVDLNVSLEDLYNGESQTITHQKQILCHICRGTGAKDSSDVQQCNVCKGSGVKTVTQRFGPGLMTQTQTTCDKCGGKGKIIKSVCPVCKGSKVGVGLETMTVVIERGMVDGQTISFNEEAHENPGETPGDLNFRIVTAPHPRFTRNGNDLHHKMTISLLESLVGFTKQVRHLDGRSVTVSRDEVTKPGLVMGLENEGMPIHEQGSFGSLFVEFHIKFPKVLSEEQKEAVKKILS